MQAFYYDSFNFLQEPTSPTMTTHVKRYDTAAMGGDVNLLTDRPGSDYDATIAPPAVVMAITHGKLDVVTAEGDTVSVPQALAPHSYFGSEARTLIEQPGGCEVLVQWDVPEDPFYATDAPNCIGSFDASIVTQDPDGVSAWPDQSGTVGATMVQAVNASKPTQLPGQLDFNSRSVLDFDGSFLGWANYTEPAVAAHMFVVLAVKSTPPLPVNSGAWNMGTSSQGDSYPSAATPGTIYCGAMSQNRYDCGAPISNLKVPHILEVISSDNRQLWEMRINNVRQYIQPLTTTFGWQYNGTFGVSDGGSLYLGARVGALHIFGGDMPEANADYVRNGLARRFGVTLP